MVYGSIFQFITLSWFLLISNPCYSETDTLYQGQELKDWDKVISSNKVFSLRFFSFGTTVSPYLGVFYEHAQRRAYDDFSTMAVWVANRNNPIPDTYGKLIIDGNGKLSILSGGGTVLDLFNPTPLVTRNASVTLLDSGNLVLQELHLDGSCKRVLWQSFDYPTDTLLPGMKLGINLKTGHRWSLTSWRNDELPAEGLFSLVFNETTDQMVIVREGNNVHWMSGPWLNGEFQNTDIQYSGPDVRLYYVSNETEQSFTYLTRTYDSYPALRMYQDGQLRGSLLKLNLQCISIGKPPGCAEDLLENLKCRPKNGQLKSREAYDHDSFVDEYVYDESYNFYDCQRICWNNFSCVAFTSTRNRVGCKTYNKKIYDPGETTEEYSIRYMNTG
ncbi:G-type lectin S-receptor-like serine/threonine-protein kinase At1g67520 [Bidens hawaiensis]|uniref:G-type lectin S-receptor-like serine/threonine-protein kinase At1g67520 n=1 Tax=Bidens hawaiensis TaxID=980011 RepID=UPI004049D2C2